MTAFTINGGGVTNWDTLSGGSVNATLDSYQVSNNTTLLIDTDSYQCAGHSAAFGSLDTVTFSGVGGTVRLSGQNVRVIAFTGGSGIVPAIGTTISRAGVSATLLGVWSGWQAEPLAFSAAMPATGFIKVKNKTGGTFTAGALTGITATAAGPDVVGWIEVRGADTAAITVPRIGKFEVVGDWFELGTTNGTRGQILPCPTTATVAGVFPGVWIETAAGSGVYERFSGAGSIVALSTIPTDERGKIVWQTTAGIRIGNDGTNGVGFLPPTGCKVRIPNVIMTCCTRTAGGSGPRVLPSATLTTRQEFVTTSAGDIDFNGAVCQWYANFAQPFRTKIYNSAINDTLLISEQSAALDIDNVIIAPTQAQLNFALNLVSNFGGGFVKNVQATRFSLAASAAYVNTANYNKGVTFENVKSQTLLNRGNATTGTWTVTQNQDCVWTNPVNIGGRMALVGDVRGVITGQAYADNFSGTTGTANPHYAVDRSLGCIGNIITGFSNLVTNSHPYSGLVTTANSYDLTIKEIGTFAAPYNMGSANVSGLIVNGGGNNDGITLKRIYAANSRFGPWAFLNSDSGILIENAGADYADTSVMAGLNATIKGTALTGATTGQVSVYGTHWMDAFTSATAGKVEVSCNEPTASSAAQCAITAGAPKFNSAGQVLLTTIGDQVTWEMPYFAKGHTALANSAPVLTGANTGNLTMQYQIDTGSGFGSVKTLSAANLAAETITAADGFKLRIIATCATAAAANALTQIRVITVTTGTAQSTNLYPLAQITLSLTGLVAGSDVTILTAGTETVLSNNEDVAGSSFDFTYETPQSVDIVFNKPGYMPEAVRNFSLATVNASLPISQKPDASYLD
jgi:hypothetical protein